jgi:putative Ca2+/H+ antiporter (TMEM165/GDT1 family)
MIIYCRRIKLINDLLPLFVSFGLITLAELGDKTQLLMLNFASKASPIKILIGVAIGTLFSHGIAILIGSTCASFESIEYIVQLIAYVSFIIFGIFSLFRKEKIEEKMYLGKNGIVISVAISIFVGELGDKTQLASIALSTEYPSNRFLLIIGAILGMLVADTIGIIVGIYMNKKIPKDIINIISSFVFIAFGVIGLITLL